MQNVIAKKEVGEIIRYLKWAIEPRITQDIFTCGLCSFSENADIVGAANIGKRGASVIQKPLIR
jgi:transposase